MDQEGSEVQEPHKQNPMKIIVPMAGRGSRLRPHTLTVPKPLVPVAGSPIVHRLVRDIAAILDEPIDEVAFVIGDEAFFGKDRVCRYIHNFGLLDINKEPDLSCIFD